MKELVLYNWELDAECYKVRLCLSVLKLDWRAVAIDAYPGREQEQAAFFRINPMRRIPVLIDGDIAIDTAEAILAYLAQRHDAAQSWLPQQPAAFAATMQWLLFAACDLAPGLKARTLSLFEQSPGPHEAQLRGLAFRALERMEDHMLERQAAGACWFVSERPTIADLALFPAFALARDYGIDHDEFPALRRWGRCLRGIEGFLLMPGIPDYH
jgi:glutathione S-transferase